MAIDGINVSKCCLKYESIGLVISCISQHHSQFLSKTDVKIILIRKLCSKVKTHLSNIYSSTKGEVPR